MQSTGRQDVYQARRAFGTIFERLDAALQSRDRLTAEDDHKLQHAVEECALRARMTGIAPELLLAALSGHLEKKLASLPPNRSKALSERIINWAMRDCFRAD